MGRGGEGGERGSEGGSDHNVVLSHDFVYENKKFTNVLFMGSMCYGFGLPPIGNL